MPDIREVLKALDTEDKARFLEARNTMRRSFMAAHASALTINQWTQDDDAFLDFIDIKLALLFDRSGRMDVPLDKVIVDKTDAKPIEAELNKNKPPKDLNEYANSLVESQATKLINEWPSSTGAVK